MQVQSDSQASEVMLDLALLLRREEELEAEATRVLVDLDLLHVLTAAGCVVQLGSSTLGLMTWRDIDIHVYCQPLRGDLSYSSLLPLASHPWIKRIGWANRQGQFQQPREPAGFYAGIRYAPVGGQEWKIDVWFLDAESRPLEEAAQQRIRQQLTPETRGAILQIKSMWADEPVYRDTVTSMDIYTAVLDHGVMTPKGFAAYLGKREHLSS